MSKKIVCVSDVVRDHPAWRELLHLVTEMMDAGKAANDGGFCYVGLQLTRIISEIGCVPVKIVLDDEVNE